MFEIAAKTANFGLTSSSPTATALLGSIITDFRVIAKTFEPADLITEKTPKRRQVMQHPHSQDRYFALVAGREKSPK